MARLAVEHANEAFCRALGYELKELIGMDSYELVAEETRAQLDETDRRVRETGVWRGTHLRRRKDGSTFPSATAVVPLADPNGVVTHFVRVERDISEESRLRDQLIHSERLSAVGQLVSGVAHELNNPLQSILGFTELLIETEQRQQDRRDLEQIRAEAVRAGKIVRNLLAFVRRSSAERSLHNMSDLVRSTIALRAYEFTTANIKLEEDYADLLPPVWVNREEVQQVILNLILNAEHAMRSTNGGGKLVLRTQLIDSNVVLDVRDNGPGIPAKLAGRVFEPFFSTKGVGEGTGLGLSIALGIAEAHGGMLAIVPTDSGACFRLTIPASQPAEADASVGAIPGSARRVLVADDEPVLRAMLQRMLMQRGYAVDMAVDGEVALSLLEARRYDLVFCDVKLPKMGGLALYAKITDRYPSAARGFVFVASDRLDGDSQSFIDRTRIPLLSKPFSADRLDDLLNRLLALTTA
jgi:two-component system NtrC family sensor kinase